MPNKAHTLTDNFNDNTRDPSKWSNASDILEINQRLEIRPPPNIASARTYASANTYDLTSSHARVEVLQALSAPSAYALLSATTSSGNRVYIAAVNGVMVCQQQVSGTYAVLARMPYDPVLHRWWQLREFGGITYWEVSSDGQNWTTLFSQSNPIPLNSVTLKLQAGTDNPEPNPGVAIFDSFNTPSSGPSRRVEERRLAARQVREQAAALTERQPFVEHVNNNDEVNYPSYSFIGNYSKGLKHDAVGDPEPVSYSSLLRALESRDPGDFEEILLGGAKTLTNPQAGLTFDIEGLDAQALTLPPAPRFDSETSAAEMGELYWMALARDTPFSDYATEAGTSGSILARAIASMNNEFPRFGGTAPVTAQNLFRGIYPGEQVGPYVSQFLLKGNIDPRKPNNQGRDAAEGYVTYGAQVIDHRQWTVKGYPELGPSADYLTRFNEDWLPIQNGRDDRGNDAFDTTQRRFIRNLRDGAQAVHFDLVVNAWWNAAFYLMSEPLGNQSTGNAAGTGRPQVDTEFSLNAGNPYNPPGTADDARKQVGFITFGPLHLLQALLEVAGRAGRAVWWQKWGVHRRLRPEEYGGRVDNQLNARRTYPLHTSLLTSLSTGGLSPYFPQRYGSYLLPQAYPEGCPTHPAYGAGHAAMSGACATLLKAFFEQTEPLQNPVVASADGTSLVSYTGADAGQLTVGGELNKLAGNIALFRNAAGVHWRSDYTESLPLGEEVAIGLLREMSLTFNEEDAYFQLTKFSGVTVRIHHGVVETVL